MAMCSRVLTCGLSALTVVADPSGGLGVGDLQSSLSSGGVEGLTKMLAAMSAMHTGASDASLHIKKDKDGNEMYDFSDVGVSGASTSTQPKQVVKVTLPPTTTTTRALPTMDPSLLNVDFGVNEKPGALQKASSAPRAATVHLVATDETSANKVEPEQSHFIVWGSSPPKPTHSKHTKAQRDASELPRSLRTTSTASVPLSAETTTAAQAEDSDDEDDTTVQAAEKALASASSSTPALVKATTTAAAVPAQADMGQVEALARGLAAVRSSVDNLLGEANDLKGSHQAAATSSASSLHDEQRLKKLEQEDKLMEKEVQDQAAEERTLLAQQREEAKELKELKDENAALRGRMRTSAKRVMLLEAHKSEDKRGAQAGVVEREHGASPAGIKTFFHRKSKRSHHGRHHK